MAARAQRDQSHLTGGETTRRGRVMGLIRHTVPGALSLPNASIWLRLNQPRSFALLGTCVYLVGFVLPLPWHLPVIVLSLMSTLAILSGSRRRAPAWPPLTIAVVVFLASMGLSTLVSEDIGRSLRLSAAFLPGLLLFVLVADHFEGVRETRLLYGTCSVVALGLALVVLGAAWHWQGYAGNDVRALVSSLGIPIFVVPNDLTFLAVVGPLSLVLFCREPRGAMGLVAAASIVLSLCAICVVRSRTAVLTMVVGLLCTTVIVRSRWRLIHSLVGMLALLCMALLVNALFFPDAQLVTKVVNRTWTLAGRVPLWTTAWAIFCEAPLLGRGPHTFGMSHRTPWPHNLYLEVLAEQGFVGLLALGLVIICGLFAAWKVQHTTTAEARLLGAGALAGLIGLCCAGGVELTLQREWVVTTLFTLLGIIGYLSSIQATKERVGSCCLVRQS